MARCLHIRSGRYRLLAPAEGIREVLDLSDDTAGQGDCHGCRLWRGGSIRVLDLRSILEEPDTAVPPRAAVIFGLNGQDQPVMLACDEVLGLVQAEESAFRPLPSLAGKIGRFFDKALPDADSGRLLLLLNVAFLAEE